MLTMRSLFYWPALLLCGVLAGLAQAESPTALVIHGGAGVISPDRVTPEREAAIVAALNEALDAGTAVLDAGGSSLDAVIAAVRIMEDAPEFNAGRGAVLTHEGHVELDASIMVGDTLNAGAIAGVRGLRHPIEAARKVMTDSPHVMLSGAGAEAFARDHGLDFMPEAWFITELRAEQLAAAQGRQDAHHPKTDQWFSTVGAVALDQHGNLAAATSTGGMTNKRWGRIGDSPIIGAGTYADNRSCAVSATGHGEFFIRHVVAYDICARMRYHGHSLDEAADAVVHGVLAEAGGDGGVIAMDAAGRIVMPFNTEGMYRAARFVDGRRHVALYGEHDH
jgi:beta-aspartyl-peptidase (threonine type)